MHLKLYIRQPLNRRIDLILSRIFKKQFNHDFVARILRALYIDVKSYVIDLI
jgi:hypothetical protein